MKAILIAVRRFLMGLKRPSARSNTRKMQSRGESGSSLLVRMARKDDIPALAALHVKTWKETYWLATSAPNQQLREAQWRQIFSIPDDSWFCLVAENKNQQLIGFAKANHYQHTDLPDFSGELNKLYLLRDYQRLGIGRRLMAHVAEEFLRRNISNMLLFGTAENPSCGFFEALGGEKLIAANGEFHGGYAWRDLRKLIDKHPFS